MKKLSVMLAAVLLLALLCVNGYNAVQYFQ